jgi:hypothetical protein
MLKKILASKSAFYLVAINPIISFTVIKLIVYVRSVSHVIVHLVTCVTNPEKVGRVPKPDTDRGAY